jgi:hypothetical protein
LVSAVLIFLLVTIFALLTADLSSWWFDSLPILNSLSTWVRSHNPWDFFLFVFVVLSLLGYFRQVQGVLYDRYNARILVSLSRAELAASDSPKSAVGKKRSELNGRRRLLESLLKFDPLIWSLVGLLIVLLAFQHFFAAVILGTMASVIFLYLPIMIRRFMSMSETDKVSDDFSSNSGALDSYLEPEKNSNGLGKTPAASKTQRDRERAEQNLFDSAERMFTLVNRPLVRIRVSWPLILVALVSVTLIAATLISEMSAGGSLPDKGTLLILLLVLTSNIVLRFAQSAEDLAFFAAALELIESSEDGYESI